MRIGCCGSPGAAAAAAAAERRRSAGRTRLPPFLLLPLLLLHLLLLLLLLLPLVLVSQGRVVVVVVLGAEAARLSYSHCLVVVKLETHRRPLLLRSASAPIRTAVPLGQEIKKQKQKKNTKNHKNAPIPSGAVRVLQHRRQLRIGPTWTLFHGRGARRTHTHTDTHTRAEVQCRQQSQPRCAPTHTGFSCCSHLANSTKRSSCSDTPTGRSHWSARSPSPSLIGRRRCH